jgi:hypothetical protein
MSAIRTEAIWPPVHRIRNVGFHIFGLLGVSVRLVVNACTHASRCSHGPYTRVTRHLASFQTSCCPNHFAAETKGFAPCEHRQYRLFSTTDCSTAK